jgi:WD40 repeat protein
VVTASKEGKRVWDAVTGKSSDGLGGYTEQAIERWLRPAAFSPDGKFIVTAAEGTARVLDMSTRRGVAELRGHSGAVRRAAFSPKGMFVVTASADGTARIYACDICVSWKELMGFARTRVTRELTPEEREKYLHAPQPK